MIYVVKTVSVGELTKELEAGKKISRESVISESKSNKKRPLFSTLTICFWSVLTKARDPDIIATSTVLSLKCPLSYSRINLPCRSILCRHIQCFDATSYLQLQEQGPTWLCPICSIPAPFENLAVDEYVPPPPTLTFLLLICIRYVRNILSNTSRSVDQVTIEPDGRWSQHSKAGSPSNKGASFGSDDEELIEIKDTRTAAIKMVNTQMPSVVSSRTPPMSSREASASVASTHASTSGKRPAAQVIDLTLSDDDDDPPVSRPPKRQFTGYDTPQSMLAGRSAQNGTMPHSLLNGRNGLNGP